MTKLLQPLASLRLTVALLAASMLLVFAGTLAQVEATNFAVVGDYFRSLIVLIPVRLFVELFTQQPTDWPWVLPWPGGLTLGALLGVNLLAAHAVRLKLSAKRVGIILIHLGLIALLAGEFVTGLAAREWQMSIEEGNYANYAEDIRTSELAIVDGTDPEIDRTVAIPQAALAAAARGRTPITNDALPFDVRVDRWMANSAIAGPGMVTDQVRSMNETTLGLGDRLFPIDRPEVTGVEQQVADMPAAYVTLLDKQTGEPLGRYMVSLHLGARQAIEHLEGNHSIELRFKRDYMPFTVRLLDFDHDFFPGTDIPTRFVSTVELDDPRYGEIRPAQIAMNEPLRHRGKTLFQSGYQPDGSGTVLQVVANPGWTLPYIACGLVTAGLAFHFGLMMWTHMRKRVGNPTKPAAKQETDAEAVPRPAGFPRWVTPVATLAFALLLIGPQMRSVIPDGPFDLRAAGHVAISGDGRVKPVESEAKATLLALSGKTTVERGSQKIDAVTWYFDTLTKPEVAKQDPVFRVDHPGVKDLLGIDDHTRKRFTPAEVFARLDTLNQQAQQARTVPAPERSAFQRHLLELFNKASRFAELTRYERPYVLAPLSPDAEWQPLSTAIHHAHAAPGADPTDHTGHDPYSQASADAWTTMLRAYGEGDTATFNAATTAYLASLEQAMPAASTRAQVESAFNIVKPFLQGTALYILGGLLVLAGWFASAAGADRVSRELIRAAVWLIAFTLILHTAGIVTRIYLTQRPPVTNLYSSAVFIGWAAVILSLVLERFSRTGLPALLGACVGTATLIVAHNLATGDTMQMMQAVLDTNFWLATHVITITLGYAATFLAGAIGIAYLLTGVYTRLLTKERAKAMYAMMYGVVAFALLFSFVGTVLGGIWADQSWGRFWGWDPKENGAILIVLIQAIILHARWGGMVQARGFAILATFGNVITAWSWFGTNMLGVGLHSYGFMESGMFWLGVFALANLAIMAAGLLPVARWASAEHLVKPAGQARRPKPPAVAPA
ncbi:MAG: cytochrome c biogenesis protein CcsA [Planctomycetota bacterium]